MSQIGRWEAICRVLQMPERMPHSEQISENHIYRWFTDIVNHGCLKHFPDLLRVKGGAGAKMEHSTPFGDGMSLTMEPLKTPGL